ncbi:MAG: hypothetical protein AAGF26_10320 [Cyanobacteria bacterium P01_G01_bin.49]
MKFKGKLFVFQLFLWFVGEVILNHLALDDLADYTHFLRQKEHESTLFWETQISLKASHPGKDRFDWNKPYLL